MISDLVVFICYVLIPITIIYVVRKRGSHTPFPKLLWLFSAFILSCGLVHLTDAIIFWHPMYRLAGLLKTVTAVTSFITVVALIPKAPTLLSMRTLRDLELEIEHRKQIERELELARQKLEERVRASDEMLENIFSVSRDMLSTANAEGYFLKVNPAFERILGWTAEEILGRPYSEFIHPEDLAKTLDTASRVDIDHKEVSDFINRYQHKDGSYRWLCWHAKFVDAGYNVSTAHDITEQLEYERALERKNEALSHFAYAVSHDLKAPLRNVVMFSDFILEKKDELSDEVQTYFKHIHTGGKRTYDMLDDLLEYTQIELGDVQHTRVSLQNVLALTRANLFADLEKSQARLTISDDMPNILGNESQLVQVFQNLISNALKFKQKNTPPEVEISWSQDHEFVHIEVKDYGIGMSEKHVNKIFGIFTRLHSKKEYEGSGIGLSLVKKILELHKGRIHVSSVPGEGTTFVVSLPGLSNRLQFEET